MRPVLWLKVYYFTFLTYIKAKSVLERYKVINDTFIHYLHFPIVIISYTKYVVNKKCMALVKILLKTQWRAVIFINRTLVLVNICTFSSLRQTILIILLKECHL